MDSLLKAQIQQEVNLYISCDGNASEDVVAFAKQVRWPHGSFSCIERETQLGVDQHVLTCMAMASDLGNIIVIEDDLIVSPYFIHYLNAALPSVLGNDRVAGVGLYRYSFIEQNHFPFQLLANPQFLYYQQRSCSNGAFFTKEMVEPYLNFVASFDGNFDNYHLPKNVLKWGDEVFEKSFYAYLQEGDRYMALPRHSLTTDFADIGVHMKKQTNKYAHQSELYLSAQFGEMPTIEDAENVFDAFYELHPRVVKKYNTVLAEKDFEMDVFGFKDVRKVVTPLLISSKPCEGQEMGWERRLKPEINNILMNQEGNYYSLARCGQFTGSKSVEDLKEDFLYYYPDTKFTDLIKMKWSEIKSRYF